MSISVPVFLDEESLLVCCIKHLQNYNKLPSTKNPQFGEKTDCPTCTAKLVYKYTNGWSLDEFKGN